MGRIGQWWQEVREAFRTARQELDAEKAQRQQTAAAPIEGALKYQAPCRPLSGDLAVRLAGRLVVWIDYTDAEGIRSQRRVAVTRSTDEYLHGFCLEAGGERQFGYFRMAALVDLGTGERVGRSRSAVEGRLPGRRTARSTASGAEAAPQRPATPSAPPRPAMGALAPHLAEARVLVYLSRRDGAMRQAERALIVRYLQIVSPACAGIAAADLEAEIRRLADMEKTDIRQDLAELAFRAEKWRQAFAQLCVKIALSDGRLHDAERNTLADFHRRLGLPVPDRFKGNRGRDQPPEGA